MAEPIVIVWDCGSTNIRAVAIDAAGKILAEARADNGTVTQPDSPSDWRIWDVERIHSDLCRLTAEVAARIDRSRIKALTITTWGADGTVVAEDGTLAYPLISWQCPRTNGPAEEIRNRISPDEIFARTGYQIIPFNTIFKAMWIRRNAPQAWQKGHKFLMVSGILSQRLTGEFSIDPTMAGTSMAFDAQTRAWDRKMLEIAGVDEAIFPRMVEPGQVIGQLRPDQAQKCNLPAGLPVTAAGHDTQFALYGSGAELDQAVLSSGTWEILMIRTQAFRPTAEAFNAGILIEQDASKGLVNPQFLMMASGALEWLIRHLWPAEGEKVSYDRIVGEAGKIAAGAEGLVFLPSFVPSTGPASRYGTPGSLIGLQLAATRGHIYRAALEGLAMQLRHALDLFAQTVGFEARGIALVGGGSKNALWNQIRADVTGLPVVVTEHKEATVLGAAMFALVGTGHFGSIEQARETIAVGKSVIEPGRDREAYQGLYSRYRKLNEAVGPAYKA